MKEDTIKILLVEDNPGDARLIQEMLTEIQDPPFVLETVDHLARANRRLAEDDIDVILLDLLLPDSHGLETFTKIHNKVPNIPTIVLTSFDDEDLAVKAVREGAQDYIVKGQIDTHSLVRAIRYALERQKMLVRLENSRQQQLEVKNRFLSYVSHELRSPLTAIYQFVTILSDGLAGDVSSKQNDYLNIVLRNVGQLKTMIDELLEATRAETGKLTVEPRCISMVDIITETMKTVQTMAIAKGVLLSADILKNLPPVYADPERIRQILINLIDNGIKFTPENGTVSLCAHIYDADPNFLCVEVSDTGCGISPESTQMIFDRLFQEASSREITRKGLGLGLFICRELIALHGGRIWVESKIGKGSVFYFTLPIFFAREPSFPVLPSDERIEQPVLMRPC
jgi:signal transduction histidine kinase